MNRQDHRSFPVGTGAEDSATRSQEEADDEIGSKRMKILKDYRGMIMTLNMAVTMDRDLLELPLSPLFRNSRRVCPRAGTGKSRSQ
jgi:hypothetical protein